MDDVELDFSDQKSPQRLTLKTLQAYLKDAATGEILDEYQVEFKKYSPQNWREFLAYHREVIFVSTLIIFLLIALGLWFLSKRGKIRKTGLLVGLIVMIILLFIGYQFLFTQGTNAALAKSGSRIYYSSAPSGNLGTCPKQGYYEFTVRVFCEDCMNGTNGYLRIYKNGDRYNQQSFSGTYDYYCSGGQHSGWGMCLFGIRDAMYTHYFNGSAYGHDRRERNLEREEGAVPIDGVHLYHVIDEGPFGYNVDANGSFQSEIQYSRSNYCLPNSYTGPTFSISCTNIPPVNGVCSPTHYNCSAGNLGYTAEYADRWEWWCNGRNGGTNILCSETKSTPPLDPTLSVSCPSPGTAGNVSWTAPAGATYYSLRLNNETLSGWDGSCNPANGEGDICENINAPTTSRNFIGSPGSNYTAWVHACNASGCSPAGNGKSFTCILPPTIPPKPTISASCPSPGTAGNVTWSAPAGTTYYAFRLNNYTLPGGWNDACQPAYEGDICENINAPTISRNFVGFPGSWYDAWVHACNTSGCSDAAAVNGFTCTPACTPTPGVCGSSAGGKFCVKPTENLCADGTAPTVSGSDPYSWTCLGFCNGSPTSCTTVAPSGCVSVTNNCSASCGGGSKVIEHCEECVSGVLKTYDKTQACNSQPCPPSYREVTPW